MKNKEIRITIILIIIVISLIAIAPIIIRSIYNSYVENIEFDIYIRQKTLEDYKATGYAKTDTYRLINLDKKKLYIINDYYVFGHEDNPYRKGHHYTVTEKDLTDKQIKDVKLLYIDYNDSNTFNHYFNSYTVKLNGKEIELNSLPFEDDLW